MRYRDLWRRLSPEYDEMEARAAVDHLLLARFGLSRADALCGAVELMTADDEAALEHLLDRLSAGEPLQYVLGETEFMGRAFITRPGALIPRPETEELCAMVIADNAGRAPLRVLDAGTGSGCLAVTLALEMPLAEVEAWDISVEALAVATDNARRHGANVSLTRRDMLADNQAGGPWDVIVSNPPYVRESERTAMSRRVVDHEPSLALFVGDDDPLLFYRALARLAMAKLRPGGGLYVEINEALGEQTADMMRSEGLTDVSVRLDAYGKERFVTARKIT